MCPQCLIDLPSSGRLKRSHWQARNVWIRRKFMSYTTKNYIKHCQNWLRSTLSEEVVIFFFLIKEEFKKKKHVTNHISTKSFTTVLIKHCGFAFNQKWYRPSATNSTSSQSLYLNSERINGFPICLQSRFYHVLLKPFGTI